MSMTGKAALIAAGAGLVIGWAIVRKVSSTAETVKAAAVELATKDLNPASEQNVVYRGVNKLGAWVSGRESFDLGKAIYHWTH